MNKKYNRKKKWTQHRHVYVHRGDIQSQNMTLLQESNRQTRSRVDNIYHVVDTLVFMHKLCSSVIMHTSAHTHNTHIFRVRVGGNWVSLFNSSICMGIHSRTRVPHASTPDNRATHGSQKKGARWDLGNIQLKQEHRPTAFFFVYDEIYQIYIQIYSYKYLYL